MEPDTYLNSLKDEDIQIRAHSIIALGKTGNGEAIKWLIQILENKSEVDWLRGCAAIALGRISGDEVIEPLLNALQDDSITVVRAVISSLGDVSSKRTVPYLQAILEDADKADLHAITVTVLGKIGGHDIMPTLLRQLERPNNQVRICAAMALSELRSAETVMQFIKLMDDEEECLRAIAASSLGLLKDKSAVEPLIGALSDGAETVRAIAASSLGCLCDSRAIPPLEEALDDKCQTVRKQTSAALSKIRSSQAPIKIKDKASIHH